MSLSGAHYRGFDLDYEDDWYGHRLYSPFDDEEYDPYGYHDSRDEMTLDQYLDLLAADQAYEKECDIQEAWDEYERRRQQEEDDAWTGLTDDLDDFDAMEQMLTPIVRPPVCIRPLRRPNSRRFTRRAGRYRIRQDHGTRGNSNRTWWYSKWQNERTESYSYHRRRDAEMWRSQDDWLDDASGFDPAYYWRDGDFVDTPYGAYDDYLEPFDPYDDYRPEPLGLYPDDPDEYERYPYVRDYDLFWDPYARF